MSVILRPMPEEVYDAYMRAHQDEYARDRMITDHETYEAALKTTRAQHESMLPNGLQTPHHFFYTIHDERTGKQVGHLWLGHRPSTGELLLYHVRIEESERRRGHGRATLLIVEHMAKELGCRSIWLNVMAHNEAAMKFYRACGYELAAMHMNKFLVD